MAVTDELHKEKEFYKKRSNELGGKILKLQEDVTRIRTDLRRSDLTASIISKSYKLAGEELSLEDFLNKFIQLLMEELNIDAAGVYMLEDSNFHAAATKNTPLVIPKEYFGKDFVYSNRKQPLGVELEKKMSFPFIMWISDPLSKRGLLICRNNEDQRLNLPFEEKDRSLVDNALNVLNDIEHKKKIKEDEARLKARIEAYNQELEKEVQIRTNEINIQKQLIEEKSKEITDSIAYAKRIQEAILPPPGMVKKQIKESFILYLPKDVVSGDFYWMEPVDNWVLFAAADCTGHGVPGAMVSVVCVNALNRSVRQFGLTDPGQILDKTRELVLSTFEKSQHKVKDGMDISLCAYNPEADLLLYSGANNSLYHIHKKQGNPDLSTISTNTHAMTVVKSTRQPIGRSSTNLPYETHEIHLDKGDSIFLSTDGYPDQFGGPRGKKIMKKRFKRLLLDLVEKPIHEQKKLLEDYYREWQGDNDQVDDVCVIGLRH